MSRFSARSRIVVLSKRNFKDLSTKTFKFTLGGKVFRGFVVRKKSKFFAYLNRCRHLPVTLDLEDNEFFTHDKQYLQCHMHGAIYEIETGLCVGGPCEGAKLIELPLENESAELVIRIPEGIS